MSAPNVVVIVLDDLGFADLGCYGSAISTPNIDRLAERGLRYSRFHVTAVCAPTRACLLTGRNHHTVGMGLFPEFPTEFPGYSGKIPKSAGTLPRLLRNAGYNTFAVGKWHLAPILDRTAAGPFDRWPLGFGFERYYGFLGGMTNQWTPDLVSDNGGISPPQTPDEGYHLSEDLASRAIRFIQDQQQAAPENPFFLYFATGAMHSWHQVPDEWVTPYHGRFDDGWETVRQQSFQRQIELGVVPSDCTLTERPVWVSPWDDLSSEERQVFARQMEVYAGYLSHTDAQVGRIIDFLELTGTLENTLVCLLSDNGASADGGPNGTLRPGAGDVASMFSNIDDFGGHRSYNHYGWGWAWSGNTPFKLWKFYSWLGGVRAPLVVQWPKGISSSCNGKVRSQFCHAIDLMPTIIQAASVEAPKRLDGVAQQALDGASMLETFNDEDAPAPRITQYFETLGSRSIYHDGWKCTTDHVNLGREVITGSTDFDTDHWSLYHLDQDFSEAHDLALEEPERQRAMISLWWHEAHANQVLPLADAFLGENAMGRQAHWGSRRQAWIARPGGGPMITPSYLAGFHLIVDIEVTDREAPSGVIVAHRNYEIGFTLPGGYACYVLDGRIIVSLDFGNGAKECSSASPLTGRHGLDLSYTAQAQAEGVVRLRIDENECAACPIPILPSLPSPLAAAELLVGHDEHFAVARGYIPPFPFSGQIHRVVYLPGETPNIDVRSAIETVIRND